LRRFLIGCALAAVAALPAAALPPRALPGGRGANGVAFANVPFNAWPTYQFDDARDGFNPNSTNLTPATAGSLHLAWVASSYDFNTGNQPILITGFTGHAGILVYGGGSGNLYAYDAQTGTPLWQRQLGYTRFPCGGGNAQYGVGGTSVYDPVAHVLYAASTANAGDGLPATITVFKLDPASGTVLASGTVNTVLNGELDFTHAGLTLSPAGALYVATGSTCDLDSWRGSVSLVNTATMSVTRTFYTVYGNDPGGNPQPYSGGGVWGWGGEALDAAGNLYFGVGNADTKQKPPGGPFVQAPNEQAGYGDHFVKLSADLTTVLASNVPVEYTMYDSVPHNLDFSGTPSVASPLGCTPRVAAMSKTGSVYVYDAGAVGSGPLASFPLGVPAFYATSFATVAYSPVTGLFYAPVASSLAPSLLPPGMLAISACAPHAVWSASFGPDAYQGTAAGFARSAPTVTAGGLLLSGTSCNPDASGGCAGTGTGVGGAVWLEDASTGAVLRGGLPLLRTPNDVRMAPIVDGDWVYVLDNGGNLYGLTLGVPHRRVRSPALGAPDRRSLVRWRG
jgi:hypothetical protein